MKGVHVSHAVTPQTMLFGKVRGVLHCMQSTVEQKLDFYCCFCGDEIFPGSISTV